jgi:hypothetical protein
MNNSKTLQARPSARTAMAALGTLALLGGALAMQPARAAEVGVSIGISQPGVYGRIDIGRFPQPQVVVAQPVYAYPPPPPVYHYRPAPVVQPVYMWVPPGHQKNWRKHCGRYGACGAPVYFVQDRWYHDHVAPRHVAREAYRDGYQQGYRAGDRDDDGRDDRRGRGHGRGHDKHN